MMNIERFHPGIYLKDALESLNMTATEFSLRTGISERLISAIVNGSRSISFDVAIKLASFFDTSINYWTNLQNDYDLYCLKEKYTKDINEDYSLIVKNSLKKYLINNRYIDKNDDKETMVLKIRKLFGVNRLDNFCIKDSFLCLKEQHNKKDNNTFLQNAWVALALKEARKNECSYYDRKKLENSISKIKELVLKEPSFFYDKLISILNDCGIAFVFLPYMPNSNIYGATKWFNTNSVMIAISNKGERADLFWFTLFHELAHVLLEHKRETLYNIEGYIDKEADKTAENYLIDENKWKSFIEKASFNKEDILSFSKTNRILPCITLGRLHKEGLVPYGKYDSSLGLSYKIEVN